MQLSIIIPAYNCSETLKNAVSSVIGYDDTEIIIVNDGSTDSTSEIISQLECKYKNIVSINQQNSGPAKARNEGIKIAKGKHIMFLDSDDTFTNGAIDTVLSSLTDNIDMLIFGFKQNFSGRAGDKIYSLNSPFSVDEFYKNNLLNQVWNKAYRKSFITNNNICFSDYRYGEDRIFNANVLYANPTVKSIPNVLYNYNIDKSVSLISGYIPEKFDACKVIHSYYSKLCKSDVSNFMFMKNILSCMTVLFADNCKLTNKQKRQKIKEIVNDPVVTTSMNDKQQGFANEIVRRIIKTSNIQLNYIFAYSVAFCQKNMLPLFLKFRK